MTDERAAYACALSGLPGMGPRRLATLLDQHGAEGAWRLAVHGHPGLLGEALAPHDPRAAVLARTWAAHGAVVDPPAALARHTAAGVRVLVREDPTYPEVLRDDIDPPAVLFVRGDLSCLDAPRVAIVGTRRCTGTGAGLARELGRDLTAAGVAVVSGLALGIDGAAHRGVLEQRALHPGAARPIGVVGSGLDVVYPARHADLWAAVGEEGLLLSEAPLGARPDAWRFPARNRIIAALADVVVVVESHSKGGSLHTVNEAERRDRPVLAAPGSVRSPAAEGTNQLLAEGCHPVRDSGDVLVALGLTPAARRGPVEHRRSPDATGKAVLAAFDWEPATLEHLAVRAGIGLVDLAVTLEALVSDGWVIADGGWYERVATT